MLDKPVPGIGYVGQNLFSTQVMLDVGYVGQNLFLALVMLDKTYSWHRLCLMKPHTGLSCKNL